MIDDNCDYEDDSVVGLVPLSLKVRPDFKFIWTWCGRSTPKKKRFTSDEIMYDLFTGGDRVREVLATLIFDNVTSKILDDVKNELTDLSSKNLSKFELVIEIKLLLYDAESKLERRALEYFGSNFDSFLFIENVMLKDFPELQSSTIIKNLVDSESSALSSSELNYQFLAIGKSDESYHIIKYFQSSLKQLTSFINDYTNYNIDASYCTMNVLKLKLLDSLSKAVVGIGEYLEINSAREDFTEAVLNSWLVSSICENNTDRESISALLKNEHGDFNFAVGIIPDFLFAIYSTVDLLLLEG